MVFSTCVIIAEFLTFSYSAPKIGHLLFDPLTYEAAIFGKKEITPNTSGDVLRRFLRMQDKPVNTTKPPCLGYDYDDKLCKLVGDSIICGYNKNVGQPKDSETLIDKGNGCFIRGDRVECGYKIEPYVNSRRPPADTQNKSEDKQVEMRSGHETTLLKAISEATTISRDTERHKLTHSLATKQSILANTDKSIPLTSMFANSKLTTTTVMTTNTFSTGSPTATMVPTTTIFSTSTHTTTAFPTVTTPSSNTPTTTISKIILPVLHVEKAKSFITETKSTENSEQNTNTAKPRFMCVDKNNSIFCYELNEAKYLIY